MTPEEKEKEKEKEFLEEIRSWGFHISDGMGDTCSGDDEETEAKAAAALYRKFVLKEKE
jgi:hypothetical protein